MLADRYGLSLSTPSQVARDTYVKAADCILSAVAGAQAHLERVLEADPDFALAHIALARTMLLVAQVPQARTAAAKARELATRTTPREQGHVNAIALAIEGKAADALVATRVHVLYEKGEPERASGYLTGCMPGFAKEGLLNCHLSWHVALLALELGEFERAWQVYRADVHPGGAWGPPLNVATDSPAFLWRSELAGQPRRPELWREVHDFVGTSFPKAGLAFADVHRAVACSATGDSAGLEQLVNELRERLTAGKLPAGEVIVKLTEAFGAFARSEWDGAIRLFEQALPSTVRMGGSRAQRDLVEYTLVAAYLKAGKADDARRMIARRIGRRHAVNVSGFGAH